MRLSFGFSGAPHGGTCHFNSSPGVRSCPDSQSEKPETEKVGLRNRCSRRSRDHPVSCWTAGGRPRPHPFPGPAQPPRTLDGPLEEGLAGLAGGHAVVVARGDVPTHEAQALGDGVEHVLALDGRVLHDATGTVLVALATRGAS